MDSIRPDILDLGILILDDEEIVIKVIRKSLKRYGFSRVMTAMNADQGIKIIKAADKPFAVILSDQNMPGMSGNDFFEKCNLLSPDSRRILITGFLDFPATMTAINKGRIHKYIAKPWYPKDFIKLLLIELNAYQKGREKKKLHSITRKQNSRLYNFAKTASQTDNVIQTKIALKKEKLKSLKKTLEKMKSSSESEKPVRGLDAFLSRTIIINQDTLSFAFNIIKTEINSVLKTIAEQNNFSYLLDGDNAGQTRNPPVTCDKERITDLIDYIIEQTAGSVEPLLFGHGTVRHKKTAGGENSETIPDNGEPGSQQGLITRVELDGTRKNPGRPNKFFNTDKTKTMDKVIDPSGGGSPQEMRRLFAINEFVETESEDKQAVKYLLGKNLASIKDIKKALIIQENRLKGGAGYFSITDILFENQVINQYLKEKLCAGRSRSLNSENQTRLPITAVLDDSALELIVSEDRTKAWIRRREPLQENIDITRLKTLLKDRGIVFGIAEDACIEKFIDHSQGSKEKLLVATGIDAIPGKDSTITYFFDTQYQQPGVENDDGTIDFQHTGAFTSVQKGDVLAEKTPVKKGKFGRDVFGKPIPVKDAADKVLKGGVGTRLSETGMKLVSTIEGQPHLDLKGKVSVCKELTVEGDVDAETGDINFQGNVFVTGCIKAGFKVNCVNLTAKEISGGHVEISGDLYVSQGIVDAKIQTTGDIKAKFVNNSSISAHGNMVINREIMGSEILLGGECVNQAGRISSSVISAAKGFDLCRVGTETSANTRLTAGVNDYLKEQMKAYDRKADEVGCEIDREITEKSPVEKRILELQKEIADQSCINENLQKKLIALGNEFKKENPKDDAWKVKNKYEYNKIASEISDTEASIKTLFDTQNVLMEKIEEYEIRIKKMTAYLEDIHMQKKEIQFECDQNISNPVVKVNKKIVAGIKIVGPQTSMIVTHDLGACTISEIHADNAVISNESKMVVQMS